MQYFKIVLIPTNDLDETLLVELQKTLDERYAALSEVDRKHHDFVAARLYELGEELDEIYPADAEKTEVFKHPCPVCQSEEVLLGFTLKSTVEGRCKKCGATWIISSPSPDHWYVSGKPHTVHIDYGNKVTEKFKNSPFPSLSAAKAACAKHASDIRLNKPEVVLTWEIDGDEWVGKSEGSSLLYIVKAVPDSQ